MHLWSCAPKDGKEYFFNRRPEDQHNLTQEELDRWYNKVFDKATELGVVKEVTSGPSLAPPALPYFHGDVFPGRIEAEIKAMEEEQEKGSAVSDSDFSANLLKRLKKKNLVSFSYKYE